MTVYQRLHDFISGTRISSSQVDEEFDQLIGAVNQIQVDEVNKDTTLRAAVQMTKITNDSGSFKLSVSVVSKDLLSELLNLGVGLHTFYCVGGAVNNPTSGNKPLRGIFHQTSTNFGWIYAQDSSGEEYRNYINNGVWQGWKGGQGILFTSPGIYLVAAQTVTPTKKLSQTSNGWLLIWSDYDPGVGANDYDWSTSTFIPKFMGSTQSGQANLFVVPSTSTGTVVTKKAYVYDDKIVGHDDNQTNGSNDVVLRYIIEW